jgi:radical SAM-linked protein
LRAYGLDEAVLSDMARVRATGVTFAPEAGTQRMRDVINKNVTEEQLLETAQRVFSRGWQSMKLYFMIGLPTEREEDVREIPRVGGRARTVGKRVKKELGAGGPPKVTVSVSTHVPKPHTPFQWCAMDGPDLVRLKQRWLEEEARAAHVDLRMHDGETSWLEAVFARGDRAIAPVLERAYRAGARFDSWEDQKKMDVWEEAFRAEGVVPARYLGTIPTTARLPWDHIDVGLEDGFLAREYRKALSDQLSLPCGKVAGAFVHATNVKDAAADQRKLVCYDCGIACDLSAMRDQRLTYLRRLGADEPRALPTVAVATQGAQKRAPSQGEGRRYRFIYEKLGPSAFLSHLDLIRALPRAFRRLGLPLFYSQGFHPKPSMMFGPALSLGVGSLCEVVDVKIAADLDPRDLLEPLSGGAHVGLRFVGGARLTSDDEALAHVIDGARYVVGIPRTLRPYGDPDWLRQRIAEGCDGRSLAVLRRIDGVGKRVEVRDYVRSVEVSEQAGEALRAAGLVGAMEAVVVDVDIRGSGSVKIAEVVEAFFGATDIAHRAVRTALGRRLPSGAIATPLDLRVLRPAPVARETATASAPAE